LKAGHKVVGHHRSLKIKKAWRGKKITVRVAVSAAGHKTRYKTIRYGKAHR